MTPFEFYSMLPREFAAKVEGYKRKILRKSSEKRKAAFIIISPHIKDLPFEKFCREFWPLDGDEFGESKGGFDTTNIDPEIWKAVKKQQNLQDYNTIMQEHNRTLSKQRRAKK
jgi:hypothetical protein